MRYAIAAKIRETGTHNASATKPSADSETPKAFKTNLLEMSGTIDSSIENHPPNTGVIGGRSFVNASGVLRCPRFPQVHFCKLLITLMIHRRCFVAQPSSNRRRNGGQYDYPFKSLISFRI
jgi:hypothetical protein